MSLSAQEIDLVRDFIESKCRFAGGYKALSKKIAEMSETDVRSLLAQEAVEQNSRIDKQIAALIAKKRG